MSENKNYLVPIAFLGLMFFSCGFALGINSLLVPVLQESLSVPSAGAYLLIGATFIPFLIFGYPAGQLVKLIGYKRTMAVAFLMLPFRSVCSSFRPVKKALCYSSLHRFVAVRPMLSCKRPLTHTSPFLVP